jgi:DNA helicase II / ATP-dependent DNA helicase PcrA
LKSATRPVLQPSEVEKVQKSAYTCRYTLVVTTTMPLPSPRSSSYKTMVCLLLSVRRGTGFLTLRALERYYVTTTSTHHRILAHATDYLHNLNDAQIEAVTQPLEGITRVVAGPGAGKTKVLTCRIAHLLRKDSTNKILAVTFTKKASGDMQERLKKLLQNENGDECELNELNTANTLVEEGTVGMISGLERVNLGTFHSICAKILRWNGKELASLPSVKKDLMGSRVIVNLDSSFAILDQGDQLRILKDVLKSLDIDLAKEKDVKAQSLLNEMGKLKAGKSIDPKELKKNRVLSIANEIYPLYRERLLGSNSLDFDDLISMTAELLNVNGTIRETLRRRWAHVLVDEFQDTSAEQLDLVKMWTSKSLLVVGDADQSIYSWRGAHVESMSDFGIVFPKVHTVYLMENYRSTTNIVRAAQKVISGSKSITAADLRQDMKPMRGTGPTPRVLACANGKAEAGYVVKTILSMIEREEIRSDQTVSILYRTNAQSRAIEEACVAQNLPYAVRGSAGAFYSRMEIKDCLCFLRWLHNGRDQSAMLRAFKTPSKGLGDKSVEEFQEYCGAVNEVYVRQGVDKRPTPLDLLIAMSDDTVSIIAEAPTPNRFISNRTIRPLMEFSTKMKAIRKKAFQQSVSELMKSIIDTFALKDHFNSLSKSESEFADRLSNVAELRQAAERYTEGGVALNPSDQVVDEIEEYPLSRFLDDVALVTDMAEENEDRDPTKKVIRANLMTIHASKGMEFDVVFVVGNEDGTFPTSQAVQEGDGSVALDEERRLCYVAMTRAKNNLIMTWRREVSIFQGESFRTVERERSRFLDLLVTKQESGTSVISRSDSKMQGLTGVVRSSLSAPPHHTTESRTLTSYAQPQSARLGQYKNDLTNMSDKLDAQLKRVTSQKKDVKNVGEIRAILSQKTLPGETRYPSELSNSSKARQTSDLKDDLPRKRKSTTPREDKHFDSTWFFPVGSSVVHPQHGPGKVLPPPPDQNGEIMVRVQFKEGQQIDLPAMTRDLFPN